MQDFETMKTAAELNSLLTSFKALQMSPPFAARYGGTDAITGAKFPVGTSIRMLDGQALLRTPYCGGAGVEVLSLAERIARGRFVDDVEGDGIYFVINKRGEAVEFSVEGDRVHAKSNYGHKCSLAAYRSQKLRHMVALIKKS